MAIWERVLMLVGLRSDVRATEMPHDYAQLMQERLMRVRLAERQIQEARSLEELDIGRSSLFAAWAEIQQIIRIAKQERGITLRSIAETENLHRQLVRAMNRRSSIPKGASYQQRRG